MKNFLSTLVLTVVAIGLTRADDPKPVKYSGTMTGIVCSACKKAVRDAFTKLGASKIEFAAGAKQGQQKVTFEANKATLTKDEVTKALGEDAKEFTVVSLEVAK